MNNDYSDYNKYDKLSVVINSSVAEDILPCYKALGWKLASRRQDKLYHNTEHFDFYRPHKIESKDRLQLLQVYMEETVNYLAQKAKIMHLKSVLTCVGLVFVTIALIVGGAILLTSVKNLVILGIVLCVFGLINAVTLAFLTRKLYLNEEVSFAKIKKYAVGELNKIYNFAAAITGEGNE